MKNGYKLIGLAVLAASSSFASAIQLVSNGDFEGGIAPWVENSPPAFIISNHGVLSFGADPNNDYAWLGGYSNADDIITQTINFGSLAGTATLTFDYSDFDANEDPDYDYFTVSIGSTLLEKIDIGAGANGVERISAKSYDVSSFMGTGVQTLEFRVTTDVALASSAFVDNVSIDAQPVPEPATMAALGLGLAAVVRRRKSK